MKRKIRISQLNDYVFIAILCSTAVYSLVSKLLTKIGFSGLTMLVCAVLIYFPLFLSLCYSAQTRREIMPFLVMYVFAVLFFAFTLALHPNYKPYYFRSDYLDIRYAIFRPDIGAIWGMLAFCICRDVDRLKKNLKIVLIILVLYNLYRFVNAHGVWEGYNISGMRIEKSYSLNYGYDVAFCLILCVLFYREKRKKLYILVSIVLFWIILTNGSRGALIPPAFFLLLCYLDHVKSMQSGKKFLIIFLLLLVVVAIYYYLDNILLALIRLAQRLNISSRTLRFLMSGNIINDNGRVEIYKISWAAIKEQSFWGNGAYGSRWIIAPWFFWGYPHNIFLEFIMEYGWMIGLILLISIAALIVAAFRDPREEMRILMFVFAAINLKLLISDSYWTAPLFWYMIGFLISRQETAGGFRIKIRKKVPTGLQ